VDATEPQQTFLKEDIVSDDPYLDMIGKWWDSIVMVYDTFRGKDQIIEFDVVEQKIYSYHAGDYIQNLSERTRGETARHFADVTKRKKFLLFIKDSENQRLRSYVFDVPE
jgi:hypothetical protein